MQYLGNSEAAVPETLHPDELKSVVGFTRVYRSQYHPDKNYYLNSDNFGPNTPGYSNSPWMWIDLPRNYLEDKGRIQHPKNSAGNYSIDWTGRAIRFKDFNTYLNGLKLIRYPDDYIEYLKLAPLAGAHVSSDTPPNAVRRSYLANVQGLNLPFDPRLPKEVFEDWWMGVISWHALKVSFTQLRMSQIEDLPDLYNAYMDAGKIIDSLKAAMRTSVPVDVQPANSQSQGFRVWLELKDWQIEALQNGIRRVEALYKESRKKMAARVIELENVDAEIIPTSFSVDPHQNPYLVYDAERSREEGRPIFTNIARNKSATWNPPEVAGRPENLKYWEQVPQFTAEHERKFVSEYGPISQADVEHYGLDDDKRINWLPWLVAGGAAAYAATQLV